jgi:hypothetical protein
MNSVKEKPTTKLQYEFRSDTFGKRHSGVQVNKLVGRLGVEIREGPPGYSVLRLMGAFS